MTPRQVVIRVEATCSPAAAPGERVRPGQLVCPESQTPAYPTSGIVQSVRFDPNAHEFVIVVLPDPIR